jgi:hypothetical protein
MEADWEVEIGGGAPVIEADRSGSPGSSGYIDLHGYPERIGEIAETAAFPPLAALLLALNAPGSSVWTSKCDVWNPEADAMACYIDLLPREGTVFGAWQQAEAFCREYVARLEAIALPEHSAECRVDLVIRQAIVGVAEGFGITAYLSAMATTSISAAAALSEVMTALANALPPAVPPRMAGSKLQ